MLLKDEQHLFRRAQVRQILLHERDGDRERYLKDLKILVTDPRIRFHLKRVVFALLRSLTDPTKEEWQIIVAMMNGEETPNSNNSLTWSVLFGSAAWFNLLDNDFGLIEMWLSRKAAAGYTATTVSLMATVSQQLPERVAELAEKYYDASEQWQDYILNLAYEDSLLQNRRFFELFLRLVDVGVFTNRGVELWQYLYSLVKNRPAWACEVLGKYLPLWLNYISKMTNLSLEQDATPNLSKKEAINITNLLYYSHRSSGLDEGIFLACAERAPTEFVKQLFPFFINIIEATLVKEYAPPWPDRIWPYGPDDIIVSLRDLIFCNIEKALILIAHHSLPLYLQIEEEYNLYNLDYKTIRYLLGKIYASKGQQFADKAINYLCKFPDKLDIGNSGDSRKITRELLQAVTPYCSDITLVRLEQLVLAYNPDWEIYFESSHLRNSHGCAQYILLGSIASTRLSPLASRRFAELQRKFGSTLPVQPPSGAGFMHSPISDETAAKMSNKQWLKAIVRYHDDYNPNFVYNHFVGGARELAGVLERCTKQEPERFATLILHLPDNTNHFYFEAILRGISGTGLALDKILVSCERVHNLPQHPCGRAICDLISYSSAESNLPQVFVKMLGWYAIQDIDPTVETWRVDSQNSTEYYGGNIVQAGLNSVRGNAASVMAQLIFADPQRASLFLPYIQQMVNDPKVSVRARIVEVLTSMLNYDRDQAVALFVVLCNAEDALFRVQALENFLRYTLVSHLTNLTPILQRMLSSSLPEVVEAGIRLSYELKLYFDGSQEFLEVCKTGNYIQRLTLSDVSARGLNITKYQSSCEEYLGQLFYDEKLEVRAKAASCFTFLADDKLGNFTNLIERFVKSPSFNEHYGDLIRALERTTTKLPDLTCLICEQLLTNFDNMVGNITTQIAYHAQTLGHLIVRIYEQTDSSEVKQRCLNLLDEMLRKKVYNLEIVLEEYRRG